MSHLNEETHVYECKIRHQGLDLADDLGLGTGIEGLEHDIEDRLLLGFLLSEATDFSPPFSSPYVNSAPYLNWSVLCR